LSDSNEKYKSTLQRRKLINATADGDNCSDFKKRTEIYDRLKKITTNYNLLIPARKEIREDDGI
jgi:hypothetical protein